MKVHVVMGTTGEYSDRTEWPVKAFVSERRAEKFALAAKVRADEIFSDKETRYHEAVGKHELDPGFKSDYTGTDYYQFAVEVDDEPEPGEARRE